MAWGEGKHEAHAHPGGQPMPRPPSKCMWM
jgi:hypothetical protein